MTRDMTDREFKAALARNGFKLEWLWMMDARPDAPRVGYGCVLTPRGKLLKRESLARALRDRERDDARGSP